MVFSEQERVNNLIKHKKTKEDDTLKNIAYFKGILKDYQVVGVNWLRVQPNTLIKIF